MYEIRFLMQLSAPIVGLVSSTMYENQVGLARSGLQLKGTQDGTS